ncbi:hypothetical protein [Rheinheimera maricola]|uniref:DUF2796 domain-containing protein n=1 Tax=Rheinheimera maricola TaxID=2793282 RepID=A0ABS7XB54_9GAMM|nr:hypothetical protein [Rheinheimera maricola]MBZ9612772.1 hypothetical protein [Rheinheimera maricola]
MKYIFTLLLIAALIKPALAHKFSTAYMDVTQQAGQPTLLWKVAIHDLALAGLIQAPNSHKVSWQQVLDSEARLQGYITQRLTLISGNEPCQLKTAATDWLAQRLLQDMFLLLPIQTNCVDSADLQLSYQALFDSQHSHKLLLSWQLPPLKANAVLTAKSPQYPSHKAE